MLLFKFGFKNFWKRPVQVILSILLIVVSFSYTGLYMLIYEYNATELAKLCYFSEEMDNDYVRFKKNNYMRFNYSNRELADELKEKLHSLGQGYSMDFVYCGQHHDGHGTSLSESEYEYEEPHVGLYQIYNYIAKEDGENTLYNSDGEIAPYYTYASRVGTGDFSYTTVNNNYFIFLKNISVAYDMDEKSLEVYGYTLYGKLPEDTYDVTIPWYLYKSFESYGYKNGADGERIEINSPEDMIGKTLSLSGHTATVVGVLNTNQNLSDYIDLDDLTDEEIKSRGINFRDFGDSPVASVFVSEEYFNSCFSDEDYYKTIISVWKHSSEELQNAYWEIGTKWMKDLTNSEITASEGSPHIALDLQAAQNVMEYNSVASYMSSYMSSEAQFRFFLYCSIPFGILIAASLLTLGLSRNKRQFAVLRSLGTKKKDLFLAYLLPVAAVMLISIILCFIGTAILSYNLLQLGHAENIARYHVQFTIIQLMDGRVALMYVLLCIATLALCAAFLWKQIHSVKFVRADKKKTAKRRQG